MSPDRNNIAQLAEAYVANELSVAEQNELKDRLSKDDIFAAEFREHVNLIHSLAGSGKQVRFRSMLQEIHTNHLTTSKPGKTRTIPLSTFYWRTAAIAAGMALITTLASYWVIQHNTSKMASQYSLLRRDLEKYKRSQTQLINNIQGQISAPAATARYTGTGFALTNDGYLVTNYHVTEGADSVYIQNSEGKYFKASVVNFDAANDIAILKVEDKKFRFGKSEVPYTFASSKAGLGARIYSLGFPADNVVYSEGYISASNGYEGDPMQYRLEIPSEHGQSGAPVLDNKGNVVAIITGKESESQGTTYAVSTKALLQLINSTSRNAKIRLSKNNRLDNFGTEQQVEKLQLYTCAVKVYKK
jgi:serine protease Do